MSDETELVWIRGTAEVNVAGVAPAVVYEAYPRAEWDAMTEEQRETEIEAIASAALEQIGGYGASVVDPSEVPDDVRARGGDI